jgi:hypothetical protein
MIVRSQRHQLIGFFSGSDGLGATAPICGFPLNAMASTSRIESSLLH